MLVLDGLPMTLKTVVLDSLPIVLQITLLNSLIISVICITAKQRHHFHLNTVLCAIRPAGIPLDQ